MNIKGLRIFRMIVSEGSLAAAAAAMNISPPAASRLISLLEAETKLQLFHRTRRRLVLTKQGEEFYQEAAHILASFEEIPRIAASIRNKTHEHLRLVTAPRIGQGLVSPAVALMRQRHPDLRCSIDMHSRYGIETPMGTRRYDLGIISLPISSTLVEIENQPLFRVRAEALMPKDHPLARKSEITAEDLASVNLLGLWPNQQWRQQMDDFFRSGGVKPEYAIETRSSLMACQLVRDGAGVTLLDRVCARSIDLNGIVMRPLVPERWIVFGYIYQSNHELTRNANEFITCLKDVIEAIRNENDDYKQAIIPMWDEPEQLKLQS